MHAHELHCQPKQLRGRYVDRRAPPALDAGQILSVEHQAASHTALTLRRPDDLCWHLAPHRCPWVVHFFATYESILVIMTNAIKMLEQPMTKHQVDDAGELDDAVDKQVGEEAYSYPALV